MTRTIKTSWVTSPVALNLVYSIVKKNSPSIEKYKHITKLLKTREENKITSKIFINSSTHRNNAFNKTEEIEEYTFENGSLEECVNKWVKQKVDGIYLSNSLPTNTKIVVANIHTFKDIWSDGSSSAIMKVYNSFNYTQDIKYESRLIELPSKKDYKLVILIPNEEDLLDRVFAKLTSEGLKATFSCIQPLFTTTAALNSPSIRVDSTIISQITDNSGICLQRGKVNVDDRGINIKVLTCLYEKDDGESQERIPDTSMRTGFYFALVFKDLPLFTGRYSPS